MAPVLDTPVRPQAEVPPVTTLSALSPVQVIPPASVVDEEASDRTEPAEEIDLLLGPPLASLPAAID